MNYKILVTGADGFVGNFICNILDDFERYYYMNKIINLEIKKIYHLTENISEFINESYDYIFHCSVVGGRSYDSNTKDVFNENLKLFDIVSRLNFDKLVHFTSAADFCRSRPIDKFLPKEVMEINPTDYFGKSKNQISKIVLNKRLGFNIRVFNLYGNLNFNRFQFIDNAIKSAMSNKEIIINNDRYFDFFLIDDLRKVVSSIILGELNEDYNLSYKEKIKVSHIAQEIIKFTNSKSSIYIKDEGFSYTGLNEYYIEEIENANPKNRLKFYLNKLFNK